MKMSGVTKMKSKKKKVKAFHQKVKVFRANDPKLAVLMWGVSHSVSVFVCFLLSYSLYFDLKVSMVRCL